MSKSAKLGGAAQFQFHAFVQIERLIQCVRLNAQFVSFTKCGHWVQWERAAEFNSIVPAFLAGYSSER